MFNRFRIPLLIISTISLLVFWVWSGRPSEPSVSIDISSEAGLQRTEQSYEVNFNPEKGFRFFTHRIISSPIPGDQPDQTNYNTESIAAANLLAQERVAYWTLWIGIFTAAGLGALIWTLVETRATTIATREIGENQSRAFLSFRPIQSNNQNGKTETWLKIKNVGNTPAKNFRFCAATGIINWPPNGEDLVVGVGESNSILPAGSEHDITAEWMDCTKYRDDTKPTQLATFGIAYYTDIFGKERKARFCLSIKVGETVRKDEEKIIQDAFFGFAPTHNDET